MDISVIIVNYNVKHFLEQCLFSVQAALTNVTGEVLVLDNNSTDNSIEYLQPKFPTVHFIANAENIGFGKACNQGLRLAKGQYVLFLNPDTIVPENCFEKCIQFLKSQPKAGALGIKMVDGSGHFLKESKRSFPGPFTSLYKLFGLARIFPTSAIFSRYHLGHLDENKNHEIDVLAGAFLLAKKEVLDKTGGFDETFFMYGEDVDLSFRIQKAGYKNFYFAESTIIHFKGESTKKGSMNYVRMFYTAMSIFVKKHYGGSKAGLFNLLIHVAIWFRAALSAIGSFIRRIGLPLIDAALILVSFLLMKKLWATFIKPATDYNEQLLSFALPAFTGCYLLTAYYAGLYDKWYKRRYLLRSTTTATLVLLAAYSLLPEEYRFSRGIILFGAILAFLLISSCRWLLTKANVFNTVEDAEENTATVIVGSNNEYNEITALLKEAGETQRILGRIATTNDDDNATLGAINTLPQIAATIPFNEIIFCRGELSFAQIINLLQILPKGTVAKIHTAGSQSIVSSNSKDSSGEVLSKENGFKLTEPYYRRLKRFIDVVFSSFCLLSLPLHLFFVKKPIAFIKNCLIVLVGKATWIGYCNNNNKLPSLRKGVIANNGIPPNQLINYTAGLQTMDYWYAKDYEAAIDLKLLIKHYSKLGS
jgi:O-antigen biosynthesis protein